MYPCYIPCFEHCYVKYGKQYDPETCNSECDYAIKCLENKELKRRLQISSACHECKDWKHEHLWTGYKFCPYCGRALED